MLCERREREQEKRDATLTWVDKVEDDIEINLEPSARVKLNHPLDQVIGDVSEPMKTRRQVRNEANHVCYTSSFEPKNVKEALTDKIWITVIHEELGQFVRNNMWTLVPRPNNVNMIGIK